MGFAVKVVLTVLLLGGVGVTLVLVVPLFKDEYKSNEGNVADVPDREPAPTPLPAGPLELHLGHTLVDGQFEVLEKDHNYYKSTLYRPLEAQLFKVFVGDDLLWDGTATNSHCTLVWAHENSTFHGVVLYLSGPEATGHFWYLKGGKWTRVREHEYSFALFSADLDVAAVGSGVNDVDLVITGNHNESKFLVKRNYDETFQTLVITPRNCTLRKVYFTPDDLVWDGTATKTHCILVWAHKHVNFSGVRLYTTGDATQVADLFFMKKDNVWTSVSEAEYSYHLFKHAYTLFSKSGQETALRGGEPAPTGGEPAPANGEPAPTGGMPAPTRDELKTKSDLELAKGAATTLYDYFLPPADKSNPMESGKADLKLLEGPATTLFNYFLPPAEKSTAGEGGKAEESVAAVPGAGPTTGGSNKEAGQQESVSTNTEGHAEGSSGAKGEVESAGSSESEDGKAQGQGVGGPTSGDNQAEGSGDTQGGDGSVAGGKAESAQVASESAGTGNQEGTTDAGNQVSSEPAGTESQGGEESAGKVGTADAGKGKDGETSQASTGDASTSNTAVQSGSSDTQTTSEGATQSSA